MMTTDLFHAIQYARQLIEFYRMGVHDACRFASWEFEVDGDTVYRYITE